jgi:hypothetical protein
MKVIAGALITAVFISTNLSNSGAAMPTKKPDYLMERLCKEQNYQMAMCRQYGSPKSTPKPKPTDLSRQGRKCTQYEKDLYINGCKR